MNILKYNFNKKYEKPIITGVDIDILKTITEDIKLPAFNAIVNNDFKYIEEYSKSNYSETNARRQTPLMLACFIGKLHMVEKLINECGQVDLNYRSAIDYARMNGNGAIISLIEEFET